MTAGGRHTTRESGAVMWTAPKAAAASAASAAAVIKGRLMREPPYAAICVRAAVAIENMPDSLPAHNCGINIYGRNGLFTRAG